MVSQLKANLMTDVISVHSRNLVKAKDKIIMDAISKHLGTTDFVIAHLIGRMHAVTFDSALPSGGQTQYSIDGVPIVIFVHERMTTNSSELTCSFEYKILV